MEQKYSSVHYSDYLNLGKLLDAQHLRSAELDKPAHDEMLFIIIHQVYELWFKQIIHELDSVVDFLNGDIFDDKLVGVAVSRLNRISEIQKILIDQLKVLETMTPLDFLDFRNYLIPASGFQSFQFRLVELKMGLRSNFRLAYNEKAYSVVFNDEQKKQLSEIEEKSSLFTLVERWLERTPFVNFDEFKFVDKYKESVDSMVENEKNAILETNYLPNDAKILRVEMLNQTRDYIQNSLDKDKYKAMQEEGTVRISYEAMMAALFINLYRDEPILKNPYTFLHLISEIDHQFITWRQRHAQMVLKMLGKKMGTGGSSGHEYLSKTAQQHSIFSDFDNISTLLIPRSEMPELPEILKKQLGFSREIIMGK